MKKRYRSKVEDVKHVSERKYPFTSEEEKDGILLDPGSKAERFWNLLVNHDLKDPMTGESMKTIEETERRAAAANDAYMALSEDYFHLMDSIEDYDEKLGEAIIPVESRSQMVRDSVRTAVSNCAKNRHISICLRTLARSVAEHNLPRYGDL